MFQILRGKRRHCASSSRVLISFFLSLRRVLEGFGKWPRPFPFRSQLLRSLLSLSLSGFCPFFFLFFLCVSNGGGGEWVQVGTYFVGHYYQVLQQQPDFVHQFYSDASTVLRIDGNTRETAATMLVDPSPLFSSYFAF